MRLIVVISSVALLISLQSLAEDATCAQLVNRLSEYVDQQVEVRQCEWTNAFFLNSLAVGMGRICAGNPQLAKKIIEERLTPKLSVVCDVGEPPERPHVSFEGALSTIHVWSGMPSAMRVQATLFHEFLHFAGLRSGPDHSDPDLGPEAVARDPVYACHVTAYPEVAERILGDISLYPVAIETCKALTLD